MHMEHPKSNRDTGRDPAHLPLMICSTNGYKKSTHDGVLVRYTS